MKNKLFIIATPIGNLQDISERAIETLKSVDIIAAEDTRHSKRLLDAFGIQTKMTSFHEHNESEKCQRIVKFLLTGKSVALISDARTPLISDPGYRLVKEARKAGFDVVPIPGACALIAALSASGLPSDRFCFEGFLPPKSGARKKRLEALIAEPRTLIFYESPRRVLDSMKDMAAVFGENREGVIARELTKQFETIFGGSLKEVIERVKVDENQQRGEFVILVAGKPESAEERELNAEELKVLNILTDELPVKQAAQLAAKITGKPKNVLYQAALKMGDPRYSLREFRDDGLERKEDD